VTSAAIEANGPDGVTSGANLTESLLAGLVPLAG